MRWGSAPVFALVLLGCASKPEPAPSEPRQPTEVDRIALMEEHYVAGMTAHDAVIRGDADGARAALAALADAKVPGGPPEQWVPHLDKLHTAAREASAATDLTALGAALGAAGTVCAECHLDLELTSLYAAPTAPDASGALTAAMKRHEWATERLWEGLTAPWDVAWERGSDALAQTRIFAPTEEGTPVPEDLSALEEQLQALGAEAKGASAPEARGALYGKLLVTCADCHAQAGVTPALRPHPFGEG